MKTKLLSILLAVTLFTACSKSGPSDETKKQVAALDSSWTAMGTNAFAMNADMRKMMDDCVAKCSSMEGKMENVKAEMKTKCDSLMTCCKKDREELTGMTSQWDATAPLWEKETEDLKTFKAEVDNSKISDEEAKTKLAEFQLKLDEGKKQMAEWGSKYNTCKDMCMRNMTACAEMEAAMDAAPAK